MIIILFFDVLKTFNNVFHEKLLYNFKKKRISANLIKYIINFINEKNTKLRFSN